MNVPDNLRQSLINLLLAVADDKLIIGHRNSDWTGLGPILEEDIAFSALAQDEMAHAQAVYEIVADLADTTPDALAFGRSPAEFHCARIVEVPDEFDWATAIARQFFCDHFDLLRLRRLAKSSYKRLADLAARMVPEEQIHVEHTDGWMIRLGCGGHESNARLQSALDSLAPLAILLFERVPGLEELTEAGLYPGDDSAMYNEWKLTLDCVAEDAGLRLSLPSPDFRSSDARHGRHSEHLKALLDEMTEVYRLEPGAKW